MLMAKLSILAFERIAKKAGVKRISRSAVEEMRDMMEDRASELSQKAVKLADHAERNTVLEKDIEFVSKY